MAIIVFIQIATVLIELLNLLISYSFSFSLNGLLTPQSFISLHKALAAYLFFSKKGRSCGLQN